MSISCPNKRLKIWKDLVQQVGENKAYLLWAEYDGNVPDNYYKELPENLIKTGLKATDILMSEKAIQIFEKGKKNNWDLNKILTELQIPKEQKQLILDLGITDREQITLELASNYSYTVEINTAKEKPKTEYGTSYYIKDGYFYQKNDEGFFKQLEGRDNPLIEISKEEYEENQGSNTQHYSNLTVPGGTNYTENEISTPSITPAIKGHAVFSTDNGIGWFRSDDKVSEGTIEEYQEEVDGELVDRYITLGEKSNTRRILEVQSDLFQKGRDKEDLITVEQFENSNDVSYEHTETGEIISGEDLFYGGYTEVEKSKYKIKPFDNEQNKDTNKNKFLQLLNKDSNWVNFFVKSIIQDSAKKGYEKVLFPTGNTASKVEGHDTLEEFKKQKEDRIKKLEKDIDKIPKDKVGDIGIYYGKETVITQETIDAREQLKNNKLNEINQLKQELERVETEGFGALKPIYNFYETTVTNILNKTYGKNNVKLITDEYGNTWNEVTLDSNRDESTILFDKKDLNDFVGEASKPFFPENTTNQPQVNNRFQINKELLFGSEPKKQATATEILKNIIGSTEIDHFEESTFFLEKAMNLLNKSGAKFKVITQEEFDKFEKNNLGVLMLYNSIDNTIYTTKEILSKTSPELIAEAFIHEVVHSVSVKAYFDPVTFQEFEFQKFIEESYEQYRFLAEEDSNDKLMYGFTNQAEFIAEIYSNPKFRNKIESLEKGWLSKLIDSVRRLFSLPKSGYNNKLISSVLLFETVDNFVTTGKYSNWKGTIFKNPKYEIFAKEKENKTELDTIEKQLNHNIERINESLKINIDKYKYLSKVFKDNEGILTYLDTLETLRNEINQFQDVNQIKGIVIFLQTMGKTLDFIENKLDTIDYTDNNNLRETAKIYDSYLSTYSVIEDIENLISTLSQDKQQTIITQEDLNKVKSLFYERSGKYSSLNSRFLNVKQEVAKNLLKDIKYFPKIEKDHYDRLAVEHRNNKIPTDKDVWIIDKMLNRDKDLIEKDLEQAVNKFVKNPAFDIYASDVTFSSAINISSPLVQIMNTLLIEIDNKRLTDERAKDLEFKALFEKLVAEKGTNNIETLYKNILDTSKTGKKYLLGEYKADFLEEVNLKIKSLKNELYQTTQKNTAELVKLSNKGLINSKEYQDLSAENAKLKKETEEKIKKLEKDNLIIDSTGKIIGIKDKWKSDLTKLSKVEREMLDFFIKVSQDSHNNTFGKESLINFTYRINDNTDKFSRYVGLFYELPKITKSDTERIWSNAGKGLVQDKWKDLTQLRPDDIGYSSIETDMNNKPIHRLKIHYRNGNFDNKDQSLDLMNLYRLEYKNTSSYKHRREAESDLNFLLDIARNKKYYEKSGTQNAINKRNRKFNEIEGENSNTFKMMQNMMEMKFYDILNKTGVKIGNVEMNKVADSINHMQSFLALSANIASGTANVINAKSQLFLESVFKGHFITAGSIKKAEGVYFKDLKYNLADLTNGISVSFTNQMLEMFNVRGNFNFSDANFLRSDMIKMGLHTEALQVFQDSGEHWIQSVTTMSVLDGIKVMNENNQFIDKKGNVVNSKDKAASLLDMMSKNKDGLLEVDSKVAYTTHSRLTKWNEGGKEKIDLLLVKKINDVIGNYRKTDQPDIKRHWWGKLVMLFRGYLVSMGQARLRGVEYSLTSKEKLTDEQRRFSNALQEYEEGTYVTLIRYLKNSIKGVQIWAMLKDNWQNLTDYERHNVKRSVTEIILTAAILPMLSALFAGAAADDDNNEYLYFVAYQIRRLETELSSYRDIRENFKMLRSPIPSVRLLEHTLTSVETVLNPFSWNKLTEEYKVGEFKGQNKFLIKQQKQIPILKEFMKSYDDWYQFQDSQLAGMN